MSNQLINCVCVYNLTEKISNPSIKPSQAIVIANTSSVNLTCESLGDIIDIKWTKDEQHLSLSNRITLHGDNRTLMISPVERTDKGEYKCHLNNPVSDMTANYTMTVSCEFLLYCKVM